MASVAEIVRPVRPASTQFIVTLDPVEKSRWKAAADAAGLTMAEYVRRAVQQAADAPTADEVAQARALAAEINASVDRMAIMLDRTLDRIATVIDPAAEAARRAEILADLDGEGTYLDLDVLAGAKA